MKHVVIAVSALVLAAGAARADVTVGTANSANCFPFCASSNGLIAAQELYLGSRFGGATTIGSVSFTKAASTPANATVDTLTFSLAFYTSSRTLGTLNSDLSSNRGALLADFGTFTISGTAPSVLTFAAPTAFTYNPTAGNLLMELTVISNTAAGSNASFLAEDLQPSNSAASVRRAASTSFGTFTSTNALVTTFSSAVAAPVPEPASWAMFIGGFGLAGAALRRRRIAIRFA